jgi:hypothetical protein
MLRKVLGALVVALFGLGLAVPAHSLVSHRVADFTDYGTPTHRGYLGWMALGYGRKAGWRGEGQLVRGALPRGSYLAKVHMSGGVREVSEDVCTFTVDAQGIATACRGRLDSMLLGPNVWPATSEALVFSRSGRGPVLRASFG